MDITTQTTPAISPETWVLEEHPDDLDGTEPFVIRCWDDRLNRTLALATVHQWDGQTRDEAERNALFIFRACTIHEQLVKLAELFRDTCSTRLSLLRDELKDDFCDPDDINDMIGHWTALKNQCDSVIQKAKGKPSEKTALATPASTNAESIAEEALDAFWDVVITHIPNARTGDLSVERTLALDLAAEAAVKEWIGNNFRQHDDGQAS